MTAYRIKELLDCLHAMVQQGCEYVELSTDHETTLSLQGTDKKGVELNCKTLSSCQSGDDCDEESDDDICYELQFSYDEIATIASALANMPSIYQKAINDDSYDPREREAFRCMAEKMLQLNDKIKQAF